MKKAQELFRQISLNFRIIGTRLAKSFALAAIILFTLPTNAEEQTYRLETLAEGLNFPWSVDFLPNGDFLLYPNFSLMPWSCFRRIVGITML
mgnify:FL=1